MKKSRSATIKVKLPRGATLAQVRRKLKKQGLTPEGVVECALSDLC